MAGNSRFYSVKTANYQEMMPNRFIVLAMLSIVAVASVGSRAVQRKPEIRVAAASDLIRPFQSIAAQFEADTGCRVRLVFGSSGLLAKQADNGAPFDLFAAANEAYVRDLEGKRKVVPGSTRLYALGRIAIFTASGKPQAESLSDLLRPQFRRIAIANPLHAPYGEAAREALIKSGLWSQIRPKIVFGENVSQAFQYAESGSADAAIVAVSLAIADGGRITRVPESLHSPLRQALCILSGSRNPDLAARFAAFVNSPQGRAHMNRSGFRLPGERAP